MFRAKRKSKFRKCQMPVHKNALLHFPVYVRKFSRTGNKKKTQKRSTNNFLSPSPERKSEKLLSLVNCISSTDFSWNVTKNFIRLRLYLFCSCSMQTFLQFSNFLTSRHFFAKFDHVSALKIYCNSNQKFVQRKHWEMNIAIKKAELILWLCQQQWGKFLSFRFMRMEHYCVVALLFSSLSRRAKTISERAHRKKEENKKKLLYLRGRESERIVIEKRFWGSRRFGLIVGLWCEFSEILRN